MSVESNSPYTVFIDEAERRVAVLDQRLLPHRVEYVDLKNAQEAAEAIRDMTVRGAPLIGVTGAAGMALAADESTETGFLIEAANPFKECEADRRQFELGRRLYAQAAERNGARPQTKSGLALSRRDL